MITLDITGISLKLRHDGGKPSVFDPIRRRWLVLTPEEHLRQYLLQLFITRLNYPSTLIAVEKSLNVGGMSRRFDIVVYDRDHNPWMLVECKRPDVPVTEQVLHQLLAYHSKLPCRYWLLSNGHQTFCADAVDINNIQWLSFLPQYTL